MRSMSEKNFNEYIKIEPDAIDMAIHFHKIRMRDLNIMSDDYFDSVLIFLVYAISKIALNDIKFSHSLEIDKSEKKHIFKSHERISDLYMVKDEPDNIDDANAWHLERIKELHMAIKMGFNSIFAYETYSLHKKIIDKIELENCERKLYNNN